MRSDQDTTRASWELPAAVWQRMARLIPPKNGNTGHPRPVDLRGITEGLFDVLRTGIHGHACPRERVGPPSPIDSYLTPWGKAGGFALLWADALTVDDELKGREWTWQRVEGAMPQAPWGERPRAPIPRTVARAGPRAVC